MIKSSSDPVQIVDNYLDALADGDFERLRSCLSDTFTYQGPTARFENPEDFSSMIWAVGQILNKIERRKTFVDGPDVCSILNFHVQWDDPKMIPVVQWAVVKTGKIHSIEVFFDATEYTAMFIKE